MHRDSHSHAHDPEHGSDHDHSHGAADQDMELWGHDSTRAEFVEGHYGTSRSAATPEGGQAGIAQGNTSARTDIPGRAGSRRTTGDMSPTMMRGTESSATPGDTLNDRPTDVYDEA